MLHPLAHQNKSEVRGVRDASNIHTHTYIQKKSNSTVQSVFLETFKGTFKVNSTHG